MSSSKAVLQHPSRLAHALTSCLKQLLEQSLQTQNSPSLFNLRSAPTISVTDYANRMLKYMNASLSVYVYGLMMIDRVQQYNPGFIIHRRNVHRLLLAANVLSAKYLDDAYYKNSFYANVGGVPLSLLNQLENQFLKLLHFNCHFQVGIFEAYLERLQLFAEVNAHHPEQKENSKKEEKKNVQVEERKNVQVEEKGGKGERKAEWSRSEGSTERLSKEQTSQSL